MAHDHDHDHSHEHDDELELDDPELDDAELEEAELDEAELEALAEKDARKQLALAQIRQYGDSALRMQANDVETFDEELQRVSERMILLMHDADGVGLAGTQVGILRRVFVFNHEGEDRVMVNPVITARSEELATDEEGCLSLGPVRVPVERHLTVTVEAKDAKGEPVTLELDEFPARVVQHEIDHLDGTLMLDRTDEQSRKDALALLRPKLALTR